MTTLPTFDDLYAEAKAEIQARNPALTDFDEGSVLDAIAGAGAVLADEVIRLAVAEFAKQFADTATGDDLDDYAADRFGLTRKVAAGAVGLITWTKGDTGAAYSIPQGTRLRGTVNGETVTVATTSATYISADELEVGIICRATTEGRETNVAAAVLDTIVDTVAEDLTATATNDDRFVGGTDDETDEAFRDRIRRYFTTLRRGTVAALETGALSVPGVQYVTVDESFIAVEDGGYVAVYIGDPDSRSNDTLADLVDAELDDWRAAGVLVMVYGATREEISLALTLYVRRGADRAAIAEAVRAAVLAYTDGLAPKETLRLSKVYEAAHDAHEDVVGVTITDPTADTEPSAAQNALRVLETDLSLVFVEV